MILDLATLESGLTEFGFAIPVSSIASDATLPEVLRPVQCTVKVTRSGEQILVDGQIEAVLKTNCSRCLEPVEYTLIAGFTTDFRPAPKEALHAGKVELMPDELDVVWYTGNEIDLTEQVWQQIVVNLPMQVLCKEDCRGLCVQCGANLNTHPCRCIVEDDENPFRKLSRMHLS